MKKAMLIVFVIEVIALACWLLSVKYSIPSLIHAQ
jgi:hypothetical protein